MLLTDDSLALQFVDKYHGSIRFKSKRMICHSPLHFRGHWEILESGEWKRDNTLKILEMVRCFLRGFSSHGGRYVGSKSTILAVERLASVDRRVQEV